ncbi:MAG: RES domain-containing protein [Nakamurella sp.]
MPPGGHIEPAEHRLGRASRKPPRIPHDNHRRRLVRAHHLANSPWWFAHDGEGRFDLPAPYGTCYLASHPAAAVRERLGETRPATALGRCTAGSRS